MRDDDATTHYVVTGLSDVARYNCYELRKDQGHASCNID